VPQISDLPYKGDTIIENDVWIGYDALIMPGIKIGDGAIISSRSVVTKNIPPYSIVGGNPAQIIRYRFDEDTIKELEEIAWWNWSAQKITQNLETITSGDIAKLKATQTDQ